MQKTVGFLAYRYLSCHQQWHNLL